MGVERTVLRAGDGPLVKARQNVTLHMKGMLSPSRKEFWNTTTDNRPFSFVVGTGMCIRGMDEGVLAMRQGEKCELKISADYGYGAKGFPAWGIPPSSELLFECELLRAE